VGLGIFGNGYWEPQGLKPEFFLAVYGTTEVVPFPSFVVSELCRLQNQRHSQDQV
jgi:hypothetical protein